MVKKDSNLKYHGKKASLHLEIVLSFVIFTGFLIFLFAIFNPLGTNDNNELYFTIAKTNLEKNASSELRFFTVITNSTPNDCVLLPFEGLSNVTARNSKRAKLPANYVTNQLSFEPNENITYIYSCEDFSQTPPAASCKTPKEEFTIGIMVSYQVASFNKFTALKESYLKNYDKTKEMLGIPKNKDIAFYLKDNNNILIGADMGYARNSLVNSKNYPTEIVYQNGDIKFGILNIQIW